MNDSISLRQQVIDCCLWLVEKGFVFGTWGNVSVRLDDGNILITPSKVKYQTMTPDDLVVLAPDGSVVSGHHLATSEREIHRGILNQRKDVGAIIHMHSPYAMAAAAQEKAIPPLTEEMCQLLGGAIPLSSRFVPSEKHVELGKVVTESIGNANAVLIRNHGPVCCGADLEEAKVCCEVVEKSAKIFLLLQSAGQMNVIEDRWAAAGRRYFLEGYGHT